MLILSIMFFCISGLCVLFDNGTDIENYNFGKYEYGETLKSDLQSIGVETIESIKDVTPDELSDFCKDLIIKTDIRELDVELSKSYNDTWETLWIKDKENYKMIFLESDTTLYRNGKLAEDLYDYKTGEIKEYADASAKEEKDKEYKNYYSSKPKVDSTESIINDRPDTIITEIQNAIEMNENKARDDYFGKDYLITAQIDKISSTWIRGVPKLDMIQGNVKFTVSFKNDNTTFDNMAKGDTITFTATFDGWGIESEFVNAELTQDTINRFK